MALEPSAREVVTSLTDSSSVAKPQKNHARPDLEVTLTRVPADEARVRAIVEALAELGVALLRARQRRAAEPQPNPRASDESGGVA